MGKEEVAGCCILCALTLATVLLAAYAFITPVEVTVDDAALRRLGLAAPADATARRPSPSTCRSWSPCATPTGPCPSCRTAPLGGELRFRGVPFARGWLAPGGERDRIRARRTEVYRVSSAGESAAVELGDDGVAELAGETAAGVFVLELVVVGEVRYQAHRRPRRFRASCPLKLSLSTATAAFAKVKCTVHSALAVRHALG
ncbi:hypothetical protein EJB05_42296, partial [Eragrostis curvula]